MTEVEIITVGGFTEITKNLTAVRVDDEIVLLDMGVYMPAIVDYQEEGGDIQELSTKELINLGAVPDDRVLDNYKDLVKGIFLGHSHLDHIAAVPYLANRYRCKVYGSPFTIEVLKAILADHKKKINNKLVPVSLDSTVKVSNKIQVEFISITHSTLQCAIMAVHTPKGVILYANDFKLDNVPTVGKKPNYERLKELGKKGVLCLIIETMYSQTEGHTPSEKIAKEMLKEVMLDLNHKGKALFVTTFSSHIARIKSAVEFGRKLKRKTVILGRSMEKYMGAAKNLRIVDFGHEVKVFSYKSSVEKILNQLHEHPSKYLVICTGSQGERNSTLDKIVSGKFKFNFSADDVVIFATKTIPVEKNIKDREILENKLLKAKVRIFKDVHVSGHGAKEDLRDLVLLTKPLHVIPSQGEAPMIDCFIKLCQELGYKKDKIHRVVNGQSIKL